MYIDIVGWCILIHFVNLCLLIVLFGTFTFNAVLYMLGLKSSILFFMFFSLFCLLFCGLIKYFLRFHFDSFVVFVSLHFCIAISMVVHSLSTGVIFYQFK